MPSAPSIVADHAELFYIFGGQPGSCYFHVDVMVVVLVVIVVVVLMVGDVVLLCDVAFDIDVGCYLNIFE